MNLKFKNLWNFQRATILLLKTILRMIRFFSPYNRYPELFDTEKDSDVTFLVGMEPDVWRLPAHKFILVQASPVFSAMLKGPMSCKDVKEEVPINDVDPMAFENILR